MSKSTPIGGLLRKLGMGAASGEQVSGAAELPSFEALNHEGEARGREHLLGRPTVIWFYPMASTPG